MKIIKPQSCTSFSLTKGQLLKITDIEGGQVVDLFAINFKDQSEVISTAATIDHNKKLSFTDGDVLYSNYYRPFLEIVIDTVGMHDLLHPCCRQEMYEILYNVNEDHPNCLDDSELSNIIIDDINNIMSSMPEPVAAAASSSSSSSVDNHNQTTCE